MSNLAEDNGSERRRENESDLGSGCCSRKFWWWNLPQEAVVSEFFNDTSLHGLKYIGQPRRHITERIFWFLVFVIGVVAAGLLIYAMIMRYEDTPVVVSFQSKERLIETIPFPAVTFCNINQFSKKKVHELQRLVSFPDHKDYKMAKRNLTLVGAFCQSQKSFAQKHGFAFKRGNPYVEDYSNSDEVQKDMLDFLVENTFPCDQMIPLCLFGGILFGKCSEIFTPVITEFGKCCTFNMLPLPLIYQNPSNKGKENPVSNPALGTRLQWDEEEIKEWSMWNYDKGFVMPLLNHIDPKPGENIFLPIRQHRAGNAYGLSVLLDPITDDYYCPMKDSEGMIFTLHTAVELPNVMEFPSALDTNKEVFIKVYPELTFADPDIRDLKSEKRECYFGKEKELKHYKPYTRGNCIDDCVTNHIAKKCHCAFYYMPRDDGIRLCNTDVDSQDGKCVIIIREGLASLQNEFCGHCLALCEDIEYKYETTMVSLQNATQIWHDMSPNHTEAPEWANHKVSIVHVFFGTPAIVPKLRKRLYGITDLIANTGGILGLCLGFSVLSVAEVIYFALVRTIWNHCRQRRRYGCCRNKVRHKPSVLQEQIEGAPTV